jgi:hypothetical protein
MQRNTWTFDYTSHRLAEAAQSKIARHEGRLAHWRAQREAVLAKIRSEGLEIDEKLVMAYPSPKAQDWSRANRVTVRDDLRQHLDECLEKLRAHTGLLRDYEAWNALLAAQPEARLPLDAEDWHFFFGTG